MVADTAARWNGNLGPVLRAWPRRHHRAEAGLCVHSVRDEMIGEPENDLDTLSPSNGKGIEEATSSYGHGWKFWKEPGVSFANNKENQ